MKPNRFSLRDLSTLLALTLLGLVLAAGLVALNWQLTRQFGSGADFLPAWNGARAFLFEDADPYGKALAERTQIEFYGRVARPDEFPFALDVPLPLLILFIPFAFIPDPTWARAVWMALSEAGLVLLVLSSLRLADWEPRRWFSVLLFACALTWFYSVAALLDGSLSILLALALVGALLAMRGFNDELAGFFLAVSAMQWETTLLLWSLLVLAALVVRRWRVFSGIGMTWFVLGAVSFLIKPDWFWPWMRAVAANWRADGRLVPARFLEGWLPNFGANLSLLVVSILLLILVVEWFAALRGRDYRRVAWVAALAVALTPLLGFSNTFANLAPLVFSFIFILPFIWERWEKRSYLLLAVVVLLFSAFPHVIRYFSVPSSSDALTFLLPPALTFLGLYWVRWYVVRPPRTWLDDARRELKK
ncbi:MAG: glycosyltransferase 87 family protein [Anaerolineales bacterium]|nr:glycosyltransferase 87 family protein [Anaerolineales bacterium]